MVSEEMEGAVAGGGCPYTLVPNLLKSAHFPSNLKRVQACVPSTARRGWAVTHVEAGARGRRGGEEANDERTCSILNIIQETGRYMIAPWTNC